MENLELSTNTSKCTESHFITGFSVSTFGSVTPLDAGSFSHLNSQQEKQIIVPPIPKMKKLFFFYIEDLQESTTPYFLSQPSATD